MCPDGIRGSITFPSCWDGKNLDSPDHRSHMAYSPGGAVLANAKCPATHPIRVPQLMYEMQWDTKPFNKPEYFKNGKQPFVYSFGDGYVTSSSPLSPILALETEYRSSLGRAMANTAITCSGGKVTPCSAVWMQCWAITASTRSAACSSLRPPAMLSHVPRSPKSLAKTLAEMVIVSNPGTYSVVHKTLSLTARFLRA